MRVSLEDLKASCLQCQRCDLAKERKHVVVSRGHPSARLMVIGEAPGADEDAQGRPFVGRSGRLLDACLTEVGLDQADDTYICNLIKCRPPGNRRPTPAELKACRPWLDRQILEVNPEILFILGATATATLLECRTPISRLRGHWTEWKGRCVMPSFHPSYLLRNPSREPGKPHSLFMADLTHVKHALNGAVSGLTPDSSDR
ncbi:uracil-DNA glycosylase [Synechococcus sp. CC9311]|uniref:uracil-DNA glycosylase n=1 Tax=Synechococcus sp. (strain CC9311) TaxID=64471 RepID=UPI0000DDAF71|nr:uracil-DNA glycosylase [Synechococcus sp. CC9311]ABI47553.1 Uracil-DNA glycosylase [Synechococcus sp. CC9311]